MNYIRTLNIDEPLAKIDLATNAVRYYHADALGSIIGLSNESGQEVTQYSYDAFGNVAILGEASDNPFQYTGRENDGIGLYYYRARYYSPALQRFISEDPIRFAGGDINLFAYVDSVGNVLAGTNRYQYADSVGKVLAGTNRYQYAGNNPVNYIDPLGLKEKKCDDCKQCTVWCGCSLRVCACSENRCGNVSFLGFFTIDPMGTIVGLRVFSCDEFYGAMKSPSEG